MTEIILRKRGASLVAVDDQGRELLAKLKDNRDVGCTIVAHRNPRHHRLYWAIIKFLSEHADMFANTDTEVISVALKLATGLVRVFVDQDTGKTVMVPKSISWGAMDQTRFNEFFDKACAVIANRWMPRGTTPQSVHDELIRLVDGEHALPERAA